MGWLWSSSHESSSVSDSSSSSPPSEPPTSVTERPIIKPLPQHEDAEADVGNFLSPPQEPSSLSHSRTQNYGYDSPGIPDTNSGLSAPEPLTPAHTLPSTVHCRTIFDNAFWCQSIGGQLANIYRYGNFKRCSQHWNDFWWCMRTNRARMSDKVREELVMKRYAQKERALRQGNSSEEIWEERKWLAGKVWEPVEEGNSRAEEEAPESPRESGRGTAKGIPAP